ncbi:class I SAM-dependent methyltransferase [Dactylosporangium sp. CA-233914]|uniref:class I SAM-dependent methyltransferase n=1 Tax=Dactylosporangium sp. CA-233914 TaxID=3239934 RepID=UPI003D8FA18B
MDDWLADTRTSYDTVAESYADVVRDALGHDPYLAGSLRLFAGLVQGGPAKSGRPLAQGGPAESGRPLVQGGPVADVGCGPGHVTAFLDGLGLDAFGLDLSPGMIEVARREHPGLRFEVGSMTDLPLPDASLGGLVAFWSLIHIPDDELGGVLGHFRRVLRPGAPLLAGFHVGDTDTLKTQGYGGHPMRVRVRRREPERMAEHLRSAGFAVEACLLMDVDTPTPGAAMFGRRP